MCFGVEGPVVSGGFAIAVLYIGRAVNNAADLGPVHSATTHEAGLNGDVEGSFRQIFTAHRIEGRSEGYHLGMGGAVVQLLYLVVAAGYYFITPGNDGADRHLTGIESQPCLPQRFAHEVFVIEESQK